MLSLCPVLGCARSWFWRLSGPNTVLMVSQWNYIRSSCLLGIRGVGFGGLAGCEGDYCFDDGCFVDVCFFGGFGDFFVVCVFGSLGTIGSSGGFVLV